MCYFIKNGKIKFSYIKISRQTRSGQEYTQSDKTVYSQAEL